MTSASPAHPTASPGRTPWLRALRHQAEYAGVLAALAMVDRLSLPRLDRWAAALGRASFSLLARRREIAIDNIVQSNLGVCRAEAEDIARESFENFAVNAVEALRAERVITAENWRDFLEVDIPADTLAVLEDPARGLIYAGGHLGNWEIGAQVMSYFKPVTAMARPLANPHVNRLLSTRKSGCRFTLIPKHEAGIDRMLGVLRRGGILALLTDQHARDRGIVMNFLGRPASVHTSAALLHLVTRIPLCSGYIVRTGPMRYRVKLSPLITHKPTGNKEADIRIVLDLLHAVLEDGIRAYPAQYLWGHRRWRVPTP